MKIDTSPRHISRLTRNTLALVLAGGRGSRLHDLTAWRVKPGVFFGGKFRIIDFPLSNCVNSGIRRIGVLTQYKAHSLIRHLIRGWNNLQSDYGEFMEVLPASQRTSNAWYAGTADAVYQNLDIIDSMQPELVLILAGDHVYKMDYGRMLAFHMENDADMTVGCIEVPLEEATSLGVMAVNEDGRVQAFVEKPDNPPPMPGNDSVSLASMGIYVFSTDFLHRALTMDAKNPDSKRDFGHDIIPGAIEHNSVYAYPFRTGESGEQGFWRDVGTIDSFWAANMELVDPLPELNLYDESWPIRTYQPQLPSAKFVLDEGEAQGEVVNSIVSGGCIISAARLHRSLLFSNVRVHARSVLEESIVFPGVEIGRDCRLRRVIIDSSCKIPDGTVIGEDLEADGERFSVSENGIVTVTREMLGQRRIL